MLPARQRRYIQKQPPSLDGQALAAIQSGACAQRIKCPASSNPLPANGIPRDAVLHCHERRHPPLPARPEQPVQVLRARAAGGALGAAVGAARLRPRRRARHRPGRCRPALLRHPAAAAQRDGHAAHGPRVQPNHHGQPDALPPHAGPQHRLGAGHGPRRHRHADRGGAPAAGPGHQPPRPGTRATTHATPNARCSTKW